MERLRIIKAWLTSIEKIMASDRSWINREPLRITRLKVTKQKPVLLQ